MEEINNKCVRTYPHFKKSYIQPIQHNKCTMKQHRMIDFSGNTSLDLMTYNEARQICRANDSRLYEPPLIDSKLPRKVDPSLGISLPDSQKQYWVGVRKFKQNSEPDTGISVFENEESIFDTSGNIDKNTGVFRAPELIDPDSHIDSIEYDSDVTFSLNPSIGNVPKSMQNAYSIMTKDGSLIYSEHDLFKSIKGGVLCESYVVSKQSILDSDSKHKYTIALFFGKHNRAVAESMLNDSETFVSVTKNEVDSKLIKLINSFVENILIQNATISIGSVYYFWIKETDNFNAVKITVTRNRSNSKVNMLNLTERYLNTTIGDTSIIVKILLTKIDSSKRISGFIYQKDALTNTTASNKNNVTGTTQKNTYKTREKIIILFLVVGILFSLWAIFDPVVVQNTKDKILKPIQDSFSHFNDKITMLTGNLLD